MRPTWRIHFHRMASTFSCEPPLWDADIVTAFWRSWILNTSVSCCFAWTLPPHHCRDPAVARGWSSTLNQLLTQQEPVSPPISERSRFKEESHLPGYAVITEKHTGVPRTAGRIGTYPLLLVKTSRTAIKVREEARWDTHSSQRNTES